MTNRLFRLINRYGAPMRIMQRSRMDTMHPTELLPQQPRKRVARVKTVCAQQYEAT
jgi:hypothetical protein